MDSLSRRSGRLCFIPLTAAALGGLAPALGQSCGSPDARFVCCGDVDFSGRVDDLDVAIVSGDLGCASGCCPGDTNWDGVTNMTDLGIVLAEEQENGGAGCQGYQPVPFELWDPNCYVLGCDPDCQASLGCLPLSTVGIVSAASFADLDADGWPDAALWVGDPRRRKLALNDAATPLSWTV